MIKLEISSTKDYFTNNGKGFFHLGDAFWTAFYNPTMEEWQYYLELRRMQNFNVIGINILYQWDSGKPEQDIYPFALKTNGKFDFTRINNSYFDRAAKMLEMAVEMGFVPSLGVLHASYVKGTWCGNKYPENTMPLDCVAPICKYIAEKFARFNPIFVIGGDMDFNEKIVFEYYWIALKTIKQYAPECLTTFVTNPVTDLPDEFANSSLLSFYSYQAGHSVEDLSNVYKMARVNHDKPVKRPVVNDEFTYEGHGFTNQRYGRYNEFHIRKGIWQSVLSGAKAGITYGSHGVWGWYKGDKEFLNESYGSKAFRWEVALRFKGAWEASFTKWLFETFNLFDLEPVYDGILNENIEQKNEIRMAVSKDEKKLVLYMPYSTDVKLSMPIAGYDFTLINLADKQFSKPIVRCENGLNLVKMHDFNSDILLIGIKE